MTKYNEKEREFAASIPMFNRLYAQHKIKPEYLYATVPVENGFGICGALRPIPVIAYLEWYRNGDNGKDDEGHLIWKICGSPMSGVQRCLSVDENGQIFQTHTRRTINDIAKSFLNQPCMKYDYNGTIVSFEEALTELKKLDE